MSGRKKLLRRNFFSLSFFFSCLFQTHRDTLDPEWTTRIEVDYFENEDDECRFEIYDWNKDYVDLKKHDFLGQWSGPFRFDIFNFCEIEKK